MVFVKVSTSVSLAEKLSLLVPFNHIPVLLSPVNENDGSLVSPLDTRTGTIVDTWLELNVAVCADPVATVTWPVVGENIPVPMSGVCLSSASVKPYATLSVLPLFANKVNVLIPSA